MTDRYGLFGFPVQHSWSPFIHGMFARQTGQDMTYRLFECPPERFRGEVLEFFQQGGKGLNVTLPHKQAAADLVNELTARAQLAEAVNTIVHRGERLLGDNTDGSGLLADLLGNLGLDLAGQRILLLGAGGAARGCIGPLLDQRPTELLIANRTAERADGLLRAFREFGPVKSCRYADLVPGPFNLIINATSASLRGEVPPVPDGLVDAGTTCYDMSYGGDDTAFTAWARRQGAGRAVQGWGMLVEQAAEAFLLWRGVRPSTAPVLEALSSRPSRTRP